MHITMGDVPNKDPVFIKSRAFRWRVSLSIKPWGNNNLKDACPQNTNSWSVCDLVFPEYWHWLGVCWVLPQPALQVPDQDLIIGHPSVTTGGPLVVGHHRNNKLTGQLAVNKHPTNRSPVGDLSGRKSQSCQRMNFAVDHPGRSSNCCSMRGVFG